MTEDQQLKRYQDALDFATKKHAGQLRRGGAAYITHPVAVAQYVHDQGYDLDHRIAALFHDLLEDTDATDDEILTLGGEQVLHTVKLLTKEPGYHMDEYIARIKASPMAYVVKNADRLHNLRCAVYTDEQFKKRYIANTERWYSDFSDEIRLALEALKKSV